MSWFDLLKEDTVPQPVPKVVPQPEQKEDKPKEDKDYSLQMQYYQNNCVEITAADKRNLQFLVNCVAKTYKIEFRKNRAPAVKLALTNIIEKFGLEQPEEMN